MGKQQNMGQQTVSEVAAIVTDEPLSDEAFRNIIEQCLQKDLALKLDKINERLDHLHSNVFNLEKETYNYQNEVYDIKEFIESNDKLCQQMQSHINELEQYSGSNSIRIFGIEKQTNRSHL